MVETDKYSDRKYEFDDRVKCKKSVIYKGTNPRFPKTHRQILFTAADEYDLERYGILLARSIGLSEHENNGTLTFDSFINTLRYLFNTLRKGILVAIENNKLKVFLPFSSVHQKYDDLRKYLQPLPDFLKRDNRVEQDPAKWSINNCLFKEKKGALEGDQSYSELRYFLEYLLTKRSVPNSLLLFNVRDFPVVRKDFQHPYYSIVPPGTKINEKYQSEMFPVISFCSHQDFLDLAVPTSEDIRRIFPTKYFPDRCDNAYESDVKLNRDWETKVDKAFFRGSTTGCAVGEENMRIKVHLLSRKYPELLDCAVVGINDRIRKPQYNKDIVNPHFEKDIGEPGKFADNINKSNHKYILNLDGHSRAYRLSGELNYNSVVLLQTSPFVLWFEHLLKPWIHYIPIAPDLEDLVEKVKWCQANDDKCRNIAEAAGKLYTKFLCEKGILDYYQFVLQSLHKNWANPFVTFPRQTKVAVITIYRDDTLHTRRKQKELFLKVIRKLPVDIFLIEQSLDHPFNIGLLKNIGFNHLKKEYDNVVFSDIDMLPSHDLLKYWFDYRKDGVFCLASNGTRYTNNGHDGYLFLGGMMSCTPEIFRKANGYPVNLYRWGVEDQCMIVRFNRVGATFYLPKLGMVIDSELDGIGRTKDIIGKLEELKKSSERNHDAWEQALIDFKDWKRSGLNNLMYDVLQEKTEGNLHHMTVRLPGLDPIPSTNLTEHQLRSENRRIRRKYTTIKNNKVYEILAS